MKDTGIVRNKAKVIGIIKNAKRFQAIREMFGSFQKYLESLDKTNNYA
jgi:3-methyladenine DNA glycosylase Tag